MHNTLKPRRKLSTVLLCGALVPACCIGAADPTAAFQVSLSVRGVRPVVVNPKVTRAPHLGAVGTASPHRGSGIIRVAPVGGAAVAGSAAAAGGNNAVIPAGGERYIGNEVITAFAPGTTARAIAQIARRHGLTQLETQNFPLIGTSLYRWWVGGHRSVADIIDALGDERAVAAVQPNYVFTLQGDATQNAAAPAEIAPGRAAGADNGSSTGAPAVAPDAAVTAPAAVTASGDPAQYVLTELEIPQAQQLATGKDIVVAVIDSEIDAKHPDLAGTVVKNFDALGGDDTPNPHGTAMAGAIAEHGKLLGIAPGVEILAIHAFAGTSGAAKGTSFAIYKGLQWAADNGARVINMSFAGPPDPTMQRMLAAAFDKGIVLVAAAGNAGPKSDPLYPAADPDVIAVTATDRNEHIFDMANRGRYITVSAPGVDVFALAPDGTYQVTTGTSVAAAHVSGVAALLLERKSSLSPTEIRSVLMTTATRIGPPAPDSDCGAGLVNAYRAVSWLGRNPPAPAPDNGGVQAKQ
jgi:hypothetical protein